VTPKYPDRLTVMDGAVRMHDTDVESTAEQRTIRFRVSTPLGRAVDLARKRLGMNESETVRHLLIVGLRELGAWPPGEGK
jgi:hypothetical protein